MGTMFKKFVDDPTPKTASDWLGLLSKGIIVRLKVMTEDGGEIDFDGTQGDKLKAFKQSLRKKKKQ